MVADVHGKIAFFERTDIDSNHGQGGARPQVQDVFVLKRIATTGIQSPIASFAISPDETSTFIFFENKQFISFSLEIEDSATDASKDLLLTTQTSLHFHSSEVLGVSCCISKQLIATCSNDKTVNLWNYADKSCELSKTFPEDILGYFSSFFGYNKCIHSSFWCTNRNWIYFSP